MTHRAPHRLTLVLILLISGCAPVIRSTADGPLTRDRLAEFWEDIDPRSRDLFAGVGGNRVAPNPDAEYILLKRDGSGFSVSYDLEGPLGVEWSAKVGEEAQPEVTTSRLLWGMGYRQPPITYLPRWTLRDGAARRTEGPARFRPKLEDFENAGTWSWQQNPFVDTQAYRGLIVLLMIVNSTDLKNDNNSIYEWHDKRHIIDRWYVVKDLGASLGTTGRFYPKRNDIDEFERHGFITGVEHGHVRFAYRGRHQELLRIITPADVRWMCSRLARLDEQQWRDAFRAGGYTRATTDRYILRIQQKIQQGLSLPDASRRGL
jgi:hypothetical protein